MKLEKGSNCLREGGIGNSGNVSIYGSGAPWMEKTGQGTALSSSSGII